MIDNRRKSVDAYMPLWIGDYLADTPHLTTEQHGAFCLLLMAYWRRHCIGLPDDDQYLSQVTKLSMHKWRATRPVIAAFFAVEGGIWRNKRADSEWSKATELQAKKSNAGKRGAAVSNAKRTGKIVYLKPHNVNTHEEKGVKIPETTLSLWRDEAFDTETAEISQVNRSSAARLLTAEQAANAHPSPSPIRTRTEGGDSSDLLRSNHEIQNLVDSLLVRAEPEPTIKPAQKPISSKVQRGSRWPAGQPVPPEWQAKAADNWSGRGLPVEAIPIEAEKFVAHWTAKAGKDATKVDWSAAWRTWYLNAYGVKSNGKATSGQFGRNREVIDDHPLGNFAAIADRLRAEREGRDAFDA